MTSTADRSVGGGAGAGAGAADAIASPLFAAPGPPDSISAAKGGLVPADAANRPPRLDRQGQGRPRPHSSSRYCQPRGREEGIMGGVKAPSSDIKAFVIDNDDDDDGQQQQAVGTTANPKENPNVTEAANGPAESTAVGGLIAGAGKWFGGLGSKTTTWRANNDDTAARGGNDAARTHAIERQNSVRDGRASAAAQEAEVRTCRKYLVGVHSVNLAAAYALRNKDDPVIVEACVNRIVAIVAEGAQQVVTSLPQETLRQALHPESGGVVGLARAELVKWKRDAGFDEICSGTESGVRGHHDIDDAPDNGAGEETQEKGAVLVQDDFQPIDDEIPGGGGGEQLRALLVDDDAKPSDDEDRDGSIVSTEEQSGENIPEDQGGEDNVGGQLSAKAMDEEEKAMGSHAARASDDIQSSSSEDEEDSIASEEQEDEKNSKDHSVEENVGGLASGQGPRASRRPRNTKKVTYDERSEGSSDEEFHAGRASTDAQGTNGESEMGSIASVEVQGEGDGSRGEGSSPDDQGGAESECSSNDSALTADTVLKQHEVEFLRRVQSKCNTINALDASGVHFVVGKCNLFSRCIHSYLRMLKGEISSPEFEAVAAQVALMMTGHMKVVACVKKEKMERIEKEHFCIDFGKSLSSVAWSCDEGNSGPDDTAEHLGEIQVAVIEAGNELEEYLGLLQPAPPGGHQQTPTEKEEAWKKYAEKYAKLLLPIKTFFSWLSSVVAQTRVNYQVKVGPFLAKVTGKKKCDATRLLAYFRDEFGPSEIFDDLSLSQVYEKVIIPSKRPGVSAEARSNALGLLAIITDRVHFELYAEQYEVAEAMSLTTPYHSFDECERAELVLDKPFLTERGEDGKTTNAALHRRKKASFMFRYLQFAEDAARLLIPHGLTEEEARRLPFAVCCSPPSRYLEKKRGIDFLLENVIHGSVARDRAKKLLKEDNDEKKKGIVVEIFDSLRKAEDAFGSAHLFLDVSDAGTKESSETARALAAFLGVSDADVDVESDDFEAEA